MRSMFYKCSNLTNISALSNWNTSNVTNMQYMFNSFGSLTDSSPINDWNISSSTNFTKMFYNTPSHPEFTKVSGTWNSEGTFTPSN